MRALGIVKVEPFANHPFGHEAVRQLMQINRLVFEAAPQPLDKNVVQVPATTVHGDRHAGLLECASEGGRGELTPLIGIEYLRLALVLQCIIQSFKAEPDIHGIRQPPGKHMAARPVHDRDQVQKAMLHRDIGDVGAPNMVGPAL